MGWPRGSVEQGLAAERDWLCAHWLILRFGPISQCRFDVSLRKCCHGVWVLSLREARSPCRSSSGQCAHPFRSHVDALASLHTADSVIGLPRYGAESVVMRCRKARLLLCRHIALPDVCHLPPETGAHPLSGWMTVWHLDWCILFPTSHAPTPSGRQTLRASLMRNIYMWLKLRSVVPLATSRQ